ncbi:THUMP domain-containing protein 1 [Actinomortierella wolfii]|nr:THUMP domain-containing protein 1 [Actinomortierella wolfii]
MGKRKGDGKDGNANKKKKYLPGTFNVEPKMKGFLVTTVRGREMQAGREICNLLSEYAEQLYGPGFGEYSNEELADTAAAVDDGSEENEEANVQTAKLVEDNDKDDGDKEESLEDSIARELAELKQERQQPKRARKFSTFKTHTDCVIFILAMHVQPTELCSFMLNDLAKSGVKRTRYCSRIIPVTETCYANMNDINGLAEKIFQPHFHAEDQKPLSFSILPKIRHNDKVNREDLIRQLASKVGTGQKHKVDLKNYDKLILVEVIKSICFMSVVDDYERLKRFNLQTIFEASRSGSMDSPNSKKDNEEVGSTPVDSSSVTPSETSTPNADKESEKEDKEEES